jgi:hypothetical protein
VDENRIKRVLNALHVGPMQKLCAYVDYKDCVVLGSSRCRFMNGTYSLEKLVVVVIDGERRCVVQIVNKVAAVVWLALGALAYS